MTYEEIVTNAKQDIGKYCKACMVCNGRACRNQMPGPGAKGMGDTAIRNFDKWQEIRVQMDTISEHEEVDTSFVLWGQRFRYPFFAGPVGAVNLHYGEKYNDQSYNDVMVAACAEAGIAAMTGDGVNPVISHDRKFVDNITTRTIEVTMGRIYDYKVNYSKYLELRKERREQQQKAYDEQQKFIAETKDFIERFKGTYSKTLQVQSRVKMLEKLEILEVDEEDTSALRLKFPPSPRSGNYPVIMENVGKTYGDHVVFKNATLTVERGDKLAFVGKNGEGKSTLVKCIMKEIEHDGTLTLGHNVQIGYFAQNQASMLDENLTVFQTIDDVAKGEIRNKIRDLLGAFMFGGPEQSMKKVKVLSGGERTRLAMIKLLLEPVNLLILDEPTNHLDMKTKDILKQALLDFDGTLIVVSHDRDFLDLVSSNAIRSNCI